ncbi:MAG: hypothetical protein EOP84_00330 [Verrucomicrobiaceae bacterium]|nr:MAG: hypothetical protein EOP84_00330 [Verrucomicrobiaceae bacterium]
MFDLSFLQPAEKLGPLASLGMFEVPVWTFLMAAAGCIAVLIVASIIVGTVKSFFGLFKLSDEEMQAIIEQAKLEQAEEEAKSAPKLGAPRPRARHLEA